MVPKSQPKTRFSDLTPKVGGKDLSEMVKIWRETAISEVRLKLMSDLKTKNLGFTEIENFSLGLQYSLKSDKMRENNKPTQKVVAAAMGLKIQDEIHHQKELKKKREQKKKWLSTRFHQNTLTYRKVIKYLREQARNVKNKQMDKNKKKLNHLDRKQKENEEDRLSMAPTGMENFSHLSVFSSIKYDGIEPDKIKVPKIGEIVLTPDEEKILRRNPKFAILEPLHENTLKVEMEKAYAKMRMDLRDEEQEEKTGTEQKQEEGTRVENGEKETEMRELESKGRQIYDPITNTYDDRKRRVTDLAECSRVTLPKPLGVT